ncbi:hypothetical protein DM02DRAFT_716256 [Periconia macrospinosa]|uniref:Sensor histidine kinase-like protein/response regulator n=1 Tax=Periconia macrospinosa TaxID=97972 RepID=A0A2V1E1J1_9PLEO|nr:hypothetical protein DM02DRAFT_716256 [Periconia macrospinosa]
MDAPPLPAPKPMTESRRHREVCVRYGAVLKDVLSLPHTGAPDSFALPRHHVPRRSIDSSLAAFAQLACLHSTTSRAMISLIDDTRQHILAEATPDLMLRSNNPGESNKGIWLGTASIPRKWVPCESVLKNWTNESTSCEGVVVFHDLSETDYAQRPFVTSFPFHRFYAGVPLTTSKGVVIGTLCITDENPRRGLEKHQILYLQDLAATIVEYLDLYMIREQFSRNEKLMRALMSFAEGGSTMRPFANESQRQLSLTGAELPEQQEKKVPALAKRRSSSPLQADKQRKPSRQDSMRNLQETILPANSRSMFSRAASVIQKSSELDGVLILDASVVGIGVNHDNFVPPEDVSDVFSSAENSSSSLEDNGENNSSPIQRPRLSSSQKTCQVLGFATVNQSDFEGDSPPPTLTAFPEKDLSLMFRTYPEGKIIDISMEGEPISSTDDSENSSILGKANEMLQEPAAKRKTTTDVKLRLALEIRKILPEALSVAFAPLWDYERSRWFAGCIFWSNRADRKLSEKVDLAYFKIFGHSIMVDLSRLDALAASSAKSSFVASISHELRSPLHGILGNLRFLEDTALDSFQISMINSLGSCGQTLLDTIDHVLDYAATTKTKSSSKKLKGPEAIPLSSKASKKRRRTNVSRSPAINLQKITEETLETVISGQSYVLLQAQDWDNLPSTGASSRKCDRYIVLDVAEEDNWNYHVDSGGWRRVVMNLIGNALKYTESGYIHVSLRSSLSADSLDGRIVYLSVKDTGLGMTEQFLANKAFQPFQQENSHSPGTGLGLSIVRQIVDSLGGRINITSAPGQGTEVRIRFALPQPEASLSQSTRFIAIVSRLQGQRICILNQSKDIKQDDENKSKSQEGMDRLTTALEYTLSTHLKMTVLQTNQWGACDTNLVICPEPNFTYLASIRRQRTIESRAPFTVFVAMDALEAATLRTDVRVQSKESVVEIMTQPCGPHKLAHVLELCLNRFASPEENIWSPVSATPSHPLPIRRSSNASLPNASMSNTVVSRDETTSTASAFRDQLSLTNHTANLSTDDAESSKQPTNHSRSSKMRPHFGPRHATTSSMDIKATSIMSPTAGTPVSGVSTSSDPPKHPFRVLIVDDNPINRRLLVTFLKKKRIIYAEAENGAEAVQKYREESPMQFNVVLMDMSMPVLDGMSATREIRDHEQQNNMPNACIIALTGLASASARLQAWSSGVSHYMTKPVNFKKLGLLLEEVAEKEQ